MIIGVSGSDIELCICCNMYGSVYNSWKQWTKKVCSSFVIQSCFCGVGFLVKENVMLSSSIFTLIQPNGKLIMYEGRLEST